MHTRSTQLQGYYLMLPCNWVGAWGVVSLRKTRLAILPPCRWSSDLAEKHAPEDTRTCTMPRGVPSPTDDIHVAFFLLYWMCYIRSSYHNQIHSYIFLFCLNRWECFTIHRYDNRGIIAMATSCHATLIKPEINHQTPFQSVSSHILIRAWWDDDTCVCICGK